MQKILTSTAHGLVKSITTSILRVTSVRLTTLASLLLATLVLAACGGGGGGSGGGGAPNPSGVTTNPAGDVNRFPDDGDTVSYTLNITRQNLALPIMSLNVTTEITGACSISPAVATGLDYGTNNQTTTRFDITFAGTETVGGRCVANFAVNEITNLGTQTRKFARTVTFSAEQAPTLVAELINSGLNIPASTPVQVAVTATKQDAGNNRDITFPPSVVSDDGSSCTATLGISTAQYNTAAGISTAGANYNVSPTTQNAAADCGSFNFTATEGSATGSKVFPANSISFLVDTDGDGITDAVDVDDDGDGLIELRTAAQLNMMRHNLNGTGLDADNSDGDNTTGGNSMGCPISGCNGYEQMADINLEDLGRDSSGSNWEPTGRCLFGGSLETCEPINRQYFSAKFNGNDYTINNMRIIVTGPVTGIGFFAGTLGNELRNMHIRNGSITISGNVISVGGLVGEAVETTIISSSVTMSRVLGTNAIGGLVGRGEGVMIVSSYAIVDELAATGGGSVGGGMVGSISSEEEASSIISSVVIIGKLDARGESGGLFGYSFGANNINSSYVVVSNFTRGSTIGGLVARIDNGEDASIGASYVVVNNSIAGNAGLVSTGTSMAMNSYWDTTTLTPSAAASTIGMGLPTTDLQSGTSTSAGTGSIFSEWDQGYCNPATGEFSDSTADGFVLAWDLGTDTEYPALNCFSTFSPAQQRETAARALRGETLVE